MIPDGWKKQTVGDMFEVQLGKMLNKIAKQKQPQFPYFGNSNVKWGKFELDNLMSMHFSEKEQEKFSLKRGDLLLCEGGEVGRCAIWKNDLENCYYQKALHRLRTKGEIIPEYFQSYMQSIAGSKLLSDFTTRTSIAHLTKEKLMRLPIKVPPLPEQTKITYILSTWNKAIETVEKLIDNSRAQKKSLMQQLLTGKKRLPGFTTKWSQVKLKDCANSFDNKRVPLNGEQREKMKGDIPYWGANGIVGYVNDYLFDEPIVLLAEDGGYFGEFSTRHIANISYGKAWVNNHAHIIQAKDNATNEWLYYSLVHRNILAYINGGTRAKLNKSDMFKIPMPLPPADEQKNICKVFQSADCEIKQLIKNKELLLTQKKALMQQLLTGKRRVNVE